MAKKMLIDATHPEETRVVVVDGARVEEFDYESINKVQISGNIYLAKVTRVEPALHAAFVDYGGNRHGFLAFAEIHPDYYQIPVADREALLAAERAEARRIAESEDARDEEPRRRRGSKHPEASAPRSADADEDDDRRSGRKRSRKRGRRDGRPRPDALRLAPNAASEAETDGDAPATAAAALFDQIAAAAGAAERQPAPALSSPSLAWLEAAAEAANNDANAAAADGETAPETLPDGRPAPDLSDVTEIEIRRAASPEEEAATGEAIVTETFHIPPAEEDAASDAAESGDASDESAATTRAEAAGASNRDLVVGEDVSEDAAPADAGSDDDAPGGETESSAEDGEDAESNEAESDDDDGARGGKRRRARRRRRGETAADEGDGEEDEDASGRRGDIEELGADDAREELRPRLARLRDYKIQEVVKRRQILLVQVVKEERGTKGAALTTYLSLAGRYCVLMPNTARGGGISRKITNAADRKRLKAVAAELEVPEGMGLIIRTAGANRTKAEIKRDYEYLLRQWSAIRDLTLRSIAPTLIYEEGSLIKRAIRDLYNREIESVQVEGEDGYREAKDYMKMLMPSHARHVQPYREPTPLFIRHQVESQMAAMLEQSVQLKSGGYIVIGVTEALVAIDVNSGRSTKESSIEETALKTNLEAADEVARQMRLRDLAGLIVIDFIDMEEGKNNRAVEKRLKDRLKTDRARLQIGRISGFGLLEMSRQRLRPGLLEATTVTCPHCKGAGVVRSQESLALSILRALEEEALKGKADALRVVAPFQVVNYLFNRKRGRITQIEERYDVQLLVEGEPSLVNDDFRIEKTKPLQREQTAATRAVQVEAGFAHDDEIEDAAEAPDDAEDAVILDDRSADEALPDSGDGEPGETNERDGRRAAPVDAEDDDGAGRKRRGRRGGRRRRRKDEEGDDPLPVIDLDADGAPEEEGAEPVGGGPRGNGAAAAEQTTSEAASVVSGARVRPEDSAGEANDDDADARASINLEPETRADGAGAAMAGPTGDAAAVDEEAVSENTARRPSTSVDNLSSAPPRSAAAGPRKTGWWAFKRGA